MSNAGSIKVASNALLQALSLPVLTRIGNFDVQDNPKLPQCILDAILARLPSGTAFTTIGNDTQATCH
jgi:hypothetical protein